LWNAIWENQFSFELPADNFQAAPPDANNLLQFLRKSALDSFKNYAEPHRNICNNDQINTADFFQLKLRKIWIKLLLILVSARTKLSLKIHLEWRGTKQTEECI